MVRHGQSESNANLTTSTPQSTRLTEEGWQQARILAQFLNPQPKLIIVSPYVRSIQSARPLREKYPHTPVEQWPTEEFTSLSPVTYRGTTAAQRRPQTNAYWQKNDPYLCHPEAESFVHFLARVNMIIARLKQLTGFTVVISHGHTIRLLWQILSTGLTTPETQIQAYNHLRQGLAIPNCAILKLHFVSDTEVRMSNFIDVIRIQPQKILFCKKATSRVESAGP